MSSVRSVQFKLTPQNTASRLGIFDFVDEFGRRIDRSFLFVARSLVCLVIVIPTIVRAVQHGGGLLDPFRHIVAHPTSHLVGISAVIRFLTRTCKSADNMEMAELRFL